MRPEPDVNYAINPYGYRPPARRRQGAALLAAAAVAVAAAVGATAYYYETRSRPVITSGGIPIIEPDPQPTKLRPEHQEDTPAPNADKLAFERLHNIKIGPTTERLLPPPEQPLPRPVVTPDLPPPVTVTAPSLAATVAAPPSDATPESASVTGQTPPTTQAAPSTPMLIGGMPIPPLPPAFRPEAPKAGPAPATIPARTGTKPAAAPIDASAQTKPTPQQDPATQPPRRPQKPLVADGTPTPIAPGQGKPVEGSPIGKAAVTPQSKPTEIAAKPTQVPPSPTSPPQTPPKAGEAGGWRIQLAAVHSEEDARAEWQRLAARFGDVLAGMTLQVVRADLGERGIYYRVQGVAGDERKARAACARMATQKVGCVLVRN